MSSYSLLVVVLFSLVLGSNVRDVSSWSVRQILDELENSGLRIRTDEYATEVDRNDTDGQLTAPDVIGGQAQVGDDDDNVTGQGVANGQAQFGDNDHNAASESVANGPTTTTACGYSSLPLVINDPAGWIASPNFPGTYGDSTSCQWLITSNAVVAISFPAISTESCCDYIRIYNGNNTDAPVLAQLSGHLGPVTYTSTQPNMLVIFRTDSSVTYNGFNATFWSPNDNPGIKTNYKVTIVAHNLEAELSEWNVTDINAHIYLHGISGAALELSLDNPIGNRSNALNFVFTDVNSVGIIKCVDFRVSGSGQHQSIFVETVGIEDDNGYPTFFDVYRSYRSDSNRWPIITHGCGTKYTLSTYTGNYAGADSGARIYITLIGQDVYSPELLLRNRYDDYFSRGGYNEFVFNSLPELGKISCINLRRDDRGDQPNWFAASVSISTWSESSKIDVNRWIPSMANVPNGIVVCNNESTLCLSDLEAACPSPPSTWQQLTELSGRELIQRLVDMDMLEFCPVVQDYSQCALSFLQLNENCPKEQQLAEDDRLLLQLSSVIVQQLCDNYLGEVSCHKECLLQVDNQGELKLPKEVMKRCSQFLTTDATKDFQFPPLCQSHQFVHCAKKIVGEQCNDALAESFAKFYGDVSIKLCDPSTKPACPYDFIISDAGCHKVVSEAKRWDEAAEKCSQLGVDGHLVFINSDSEKQHINNMLQNRAVIGCNEYGEQSNSVTVWTGGRRKEYPPLYRWHYNYTTAAGLVCSSEWNVQRNDGSGSRPNCIKIKGNDKIDYEWQTSDCYNGYCFICEIDL